MEIETTPAVELLRLLGWRAGMSDASGTAQKTLCHTDRPRDPLHHRAQGFSAGKCPVSNSLL